MAVVLNEFQRKNNLVTLRDGGILYSSEAREVAKINKVVIHGGGGGLQKLSWLPSLGLYGYKYTKGSSSMVKPR